MGIRVKFKVPITYAELREKAEHFFHCVYLAAVSYEAHGMYQIAAGVLLVVTVSGVFIVREIHGDADDEHD